MTITIKLPLRRRCYQKKQYGGIWNWCKMVQSRTHVGPPPRLTARRRTMTITIKLPLRRVPPKEAVWGHMKLMQNGARLNWCKTESMLAHLPGGPYLLEEGRCGIPLTSQSCVVKHYTNTELCSIISTSWLYILCIPCTMVIALPDYLFYWSLPSRFVCGHYILATY